MLKLRKAPLTISAAATLAFIVAACGSTPPPAATPSPALGGTAIPAPVDSPETPVPTAAPTSDQTHSAPPSSTAIASPASTPAPVPAATRSPVPTPTTVATAAAAPAEATAAREAVQERVSKLSETAGKILARLIGDFGPRETATAEEKAAAVFLLARFQDLGYQARLQPFTVEVLSQEPPVLSVQSPQELDVRALPMSKSGMGTASGLLVDLGLALEDDIPTGGLDGKVALIERGSITFEEKVSRAEQAGAVAAVVYNNRDGLFRGALSNDGAIPAVGISRESGEKLKLLLESHAVEVTVSLVMETRDSRNVIAEIPGTEAGGGVVVLGAHYDTVPQVPGANDNGSGVVALLTLAGEVVDSSYPFALRFILFGSEEVGLVGSQHYVETLSDAKREEIIAMLNFDSLGTGKGIGALGTPELTRAVAEYGRANGVDVDRQFSLNGGSSDHASFSAAGIPVVFFIADDISHIHTPTDTVEFVRPELIGTGAVLALGLLDWLAEGHGPD